MQSEIIKYQGRKYIVEEYNKGNVKYYQVEDTYMGENYAYQYSSDGLTRIDDGNNLNAENVHQLLQKIINSNDELFKIGN